MGMLEDCRRLLERSDYAGLKANLGSCDLSSLVSDWAALKPMEKLVLFKLMEPARAMELYGGLDFDDKYFLLNGFSLESISPVLERLSDRERSLFSPMPAACYDRMLRMTVGGEIEFDIHESQN